MASQNHAAPCALRTGLMKLNLLRWTRVTTRVSVVKIQIAGIAMRAAAQVDWRAAMTSTGTAAQYAAPRNAAVMNGDTGGGPIVHAKNVAVSSEKTVSWKPARKTKRLAAYRSRRIHLVSRRTLGAGPGSVTVSVPRGTPGP